MKTIIAGSRTITDYKLIKNVIVRSKIEITEEVCGCAKGVDRLGEVYANENNIPVIHFQARWDLYRRSAGSKRNKQMAEYADAAIIIWDGFSRGSKNMFEIARKLGLYTCLYNQATSEFDIYPSRLRELK